MRLLPEPSASSAVFCLVILTVIFLENLTEVGLFRASDLAWTLLVYAFMQLKLQAKALRQAAPSARPRLSSLRAPASA